MKKVILSIGFALLGLGAMAQGVSANNLTKATASAQHTVTLNLSNVIDIRFNPNVTQQTTFTFDDADKMESGLTTNGVAAEIQVRSNKNYTVSVKAAQSDFTYAGDGVAGTDNISMPATVLSVGKYATSPVQATDESGNLLFETDLFGNQLLDGLNNPIPVMTTQNTTAYQQLTDSDASFIANGTKGGFAGNGTQISYKAEPGLNYAAGEYTIDVVFTATAK